MIVITDSNIIISALIKPNGAIAKIFKTKNNIQFFAPSLLKDEILKHLSKIVSLSGISRNEVKAAFKEFENKITFIDISNIPKTHILKAYDIVSDIDPDDVFFVALYQYKKYKIWTSDLKLIKGLENKGYKICITTNEIAKKMYKK